MKKFKRCEYFWNLSCPTDWSRWVKKSVYFIYSKFVKIKNSLFVLSITESACTFFIFISFKVVIQGQYINGHKLIRLVDSVKAAISIKEPKAFFFFFSGGSKSACQT